MINNNIKKHLRRSHLFRMLSKTGKAIKRDFEIYARKQQKSLQYHWMMYVLSIIPPIPLPFVFVVFFAENLWNFMFMFLSD
jgi:hypothetical protein